MTKKNEIIYSHKNLYVNVADYQDLFLAKMKKWVKHQTTNDKQNDISVYKENII